MSLRGDLRSGEELLGEALCAQAGLRAGPPKRGGVVDLTLGHQVDQYDGSVAAPSVVGAEHHGAQAQHRGDQGHREHAQLACAPLPAQEPQTERDPAGASLSHVGCGPPRARSSARSARRAACRG